MSHSPSPLLRVAGLIDACNMRLGQLCAWITLFLVIGTTIVVVLRYGFGIGAIALQEAVMYGHALVFMALPPGPCSATVTCASISSIRSSVAAGRRP